MLFTMWYVDKSSATGNHGSNHSESAIDREVAPVASGVYAGVAASSIGLTRPAAAAPLMPLGTAAACGACTARAARAALCAEHRLHFAALDEHLLERDAKGTAQRPQPKPPPVRLPQAASISHVHPPPACHCLEAHVHTE